MDCRQNCFNWLDPGPVRFCCSHGVALALVLQPARWLGTNTTSSLSVRPLGPPARRLRIYFHLAALCSVSPSALTLAQWPAAFLRASIELICNLQQPAAHP